MIAKILIGATAVLLADTMYLAGWDMRNTYINWIKPINEGQWS